MLLAVVALSTTSLPAHAERTTVADEAGDGQPGHLDVTQLRISNRDRAIVIKLAFVEDAPGALVVRLAARNHSSEVGISSEHRRRGRDNTYLDGARCNGLTSDWDRRAAKLTLRMPARCLNNGNYGAVRGTATTFTRGFMTAVDFAPDLERGTEAYTRWVPRG